MYICNISWVSHVWCMSWEGHVLYKLKDVDAYTCRYYSSLSIKFDDDHCYSPPPPTHPTVEGSQDSSNTESTDHHGSQPAASLASKTTLDQSTAAPVITSSNDPTSASAHSATGAQIHVAQPAVPSSEGEFPQQIEWHRWCSTTSEPGSLQPPSCWLTQVGMMMMMA